LALVAGTGSHCLGIDALGRTARTLGLEYALSDEGSAFYLGDRVLRAVVRACDGRGRPTALVAAVFSSLGVSCLADLFDRVYALASLKQGVASFARHATRAAEQGDPVARGIVEDAAACLVEAVLAVARELGLGEVPCEVIAMGGVLADSDLMRSLLAAGVGRALPAATLHFKEPNSALGAARLARDRPRHDLWRCHERPGPGGRGVSAAAPRRSRRSAGG
jgi:N-acetylglucosamine kinase-like BadF-type ATPase